METLKMLVLSLAAALAAAQTPDAPSTEIDDLVVVTGSRTPIAADELGASISVIDAEALARSGAAFALEALAAVPGLAVVQPGAPGQFAEVRIRGAEANQTLVFVDGIEAGDIGGASAFSFETLPTFDIERIEVVRGAQSALYGSEAIGGVIAVRTKRGAPGLQLDAEAEAGSFDTRRGGLGIGGGSERASGRISASYYETGGENLALVGSEEDGSEIWSVSARGDATLTEGLSARALARFISTDVQSDPEGFGATTLPNGEPDPLSVLQDADSRSRQDDLYALVGLDWTLFDGAWEHSANFALTDTDNTFLSAFGETIIDGRRLKGIYQSSVQYRIGTADAVTTFVVEHEDNEYETAGFSTFDRSDKQTSFVGEQRLAFSDRVFVNGAARFDANDRFEDALTGRATISALLTDGAVRTRLHSSYGTGIINPTFTELFGFANNLAPNPDLEPESSRSFDIGLEASTGAARIDVTYFNATLDDEIVTGVDGGGQLIAVNQPGESDRQGVEIEADAAIGLLSIRAGYAWLDATDPDGSEEVRRPEHSASLDAALSAGRVTATLGVLYNGERDDDVFGQFVPGVGSQIFRVSLEEYLIVRLGAEAEIADGVTAYVRAENLTDEEYEDIFGYRSLGRGLYGGVRITF
ncbi:MAG: TonB-dependent receptor [Pseudomonadota bacterium]